MNIRDDNAVDHTANSAVPADRFAIEELLESEVELVAVWIGGAGGRRPVECAMSLLQARSSPVRSGGAAAGPDEEERSEGNDARGRRLAPSASGLRSYSATCGSVDPDPVRL